MAETVKNPMFVIEVLQLELDHLIAKLVKMELFENNEDDIKKDIKKEIKIYTEEIKRRGDV